ncbi:hypothetical protein niasHT_001254 [Heterodera trifolii]|uniref:Doublecortin domain-containing protein n=1 Tax=Heterodera trifolii TaxID=157864 RepID=A0ABD2M9H8_9BILA
MRAANAVGPTHVRLTPEGSRRIRVYRNGDAHFKGITIVLNTRQVHSIDSLLDMISEKIGLVMGCKRLFTLDGTPVKSMEQLQHNVEYVAASGMFTPARYGRVGSAALHSASMLARSSSNFSAASREDPLAQSGASKQSAPASLAFGTAHAPLRHSRSIEPRRTVGRPPPAQMNGQTNRKNADERSRKVDGKKARDGSKKRKTPKKKANDDVPSGDAPPVEEAAAPEAKENGENGRPENGAQKEEAEEETAAAEEEAEKQEEEEAEEEPAPRMRTEVEVVEHDEEHQQKEEGEEEEEEEHLANGTTPAESARSVRAPTAQAEEEEEAEEGAESDGQAKENVGEEGHGQTTTDGQKTEEEK